jgi:sugar/nucleoside kinase (ribokinase family)
MAKKKNGNSMSQEIRNVLKEHPRMKAKQVVATLAERGIVVKEGLVYFIKGEKKGRKKKAGKTAATVTATTGAGDALAMILKVKTLADHVGGMKKLKAIIDALSE